LAVVLFPNTLKLLSRQFDKKSGWVSLIWPSRILGKLMNITRERIWLGLGSFEFRKLTSSYFAGIIARPSRY